MSGTADYSAAATSRRTRPAWLPTLVALLMVPLLVYLGLWQLDRAEQKRRLQADFAAGGEPLLLETASQVSTLAELRRFQPVTLNGRYLGARQFLLDNMTEDGTAGYHVLTPFASEAGPVVIVNRGWVEKDYGGGLPEIGVGAEPRSVQGRVARLPRPGIAVGDTTSNTGWPRVVHFPDTADLGRMIETEVLKPVLLLAPAEPDGYTRNWQPTGTGPERHMAYALQWFAFAATLVVIWIVMFIRRRRKAQ